MTLFGKLNAKMKTTPVRVRPTWFRGAVAVTLLALPLAACKSDRVVTGSVPTSVEERYPIGVTPERVKLDLNATGSNLSLYDREAVQEFVLGWRERGTGGMAVFAPVDSRNAADAASVVDEVLLIAGDYGMPVDAIHVSNYRTTLSIAPVRLAYDRMVTTVNCGAWPTNAAGSWRNLPYENFGCAYQKNMAAVIADPRDLEGPRSTQPRDAQRRDTVFDKYRKGEDPSTVYNDNEAGEVSEVEN